MGNDQKENKIEKEIIETTKKRKNEIDKKKYKNLDIDKNFIENALKENNKFRDMHGVKPLELDDYLNKRAFILANELLTKGEFDNENLLYKNREDLGMNIKMSNEDIEAEKLMEIWYEENRGYNYQEPDELECNNFTQMIWKNSVKFGIGYCHLLRKKENVKNINIDNTEENNEIKNPKIYQFCYIALYYPVGNKPGEYKDNVKEKKQKKKDGNIVNEFTILSSDPNLLEANEEQENTEKENVLNEDNNSPDYII